MPASAQPRTNRPAAAPAYYLGRPVHLWLTAMRPARPPRAGRPASRAAAPPEAR